MGRIAAVDFGLKRLGVALSDERHILASPLQLVLAGRTSDETCQRLLQALENHNVEEIIIGNPIHLSGKVSFLSDEVGHFVSLLSKKTPIPIKLWDERLTSVQAERTMKDAGLSRKKRAKSVDLLSAIILLQSYLDSKSRDVIK